MEAALEELEARNRRLEMECNRLRVEGVRRGHARMCACVGGVAARGGLQPLGYLWGSAAYKPTSGLIGMVWQPDSAVPLELLACLAWPNVHNLCTCCRSHCSMTSRRQQRR